MRYVKQKSLREQIEVGKPVDIEMIDGIHKTIVLEANDIYFIAATGKRKFKVSFETGKVKDITEYGMRKDR